MQHQLSEADKITTLTFDAETLLTETNTGGKSKTTSKAFADQPDCIKTAHIRFVAGTVPGVRTDYGYFSLYRL